MTRDAERRRRAWLGGIWIVVTLLILLSGLMTLLHAWPPSIMVFFIGIWLVVSVVAASAFRSRSSTSDR
jgi:hypothetical protein